MICPHNSHSTQMRSPSHSSFTCHHFCLLIWCRSLAGTDLRALFSWSCTKTFHQNHVQFSSFHAMLIHTAHSDIPRVSLCVCCQRAEPGPKALQKCISMSLRAVLLKFLYRQRVFSSSLEPLSRRPGCGFCCASEKTGYGQGVERPHRGHLPNPDLASSNQTAPIQYEGSCTLP